MRALQPWLLWFLIVPSVLGVGCRCARGPVVENSTTIAEAENDAAKATIVYDYFHGRQKSYDSPVWNRDPTTRETLTLLVTVDGVEQRKRLDIRKQSNKEDQAPNGSLKAELVLDPSGERVAYKLSDGDWELVYVTSSPWLFQAESGVLAGAPAGDWADVPTFREALPSLLRAHEAPKGIYEEVNRVRIFGHLHDTFDEKAFEDVLVEVAALDFALWGRWSYATNRLGPDAKASLGARLRAMVVEDPNPYLLKRAFPFLELEDASLAELIHAAPATLIKDPDLRLWARHARNGYLEASARLDAQRARETACVLIEGGVEPDELPEALTQGCTPPKP